MAKIEVNPVTDTGDLLVVNSARASFAVKHDKFDYLKDPKLLKFLAKGYPDHMHWTPYAHPQITLTRSLHQFKLIQWLLNRSPGGDTVQVPDADEPYDMIRVVERGSVWFWVNNLRHLPEGDQFRISEHILNHMPHTYQAFWEAGIPGLVPQNKLLKGARPENPTRIRIVGYDRLRLDTDFEKLPLKDRAKILTATIHIFCPFPIRTQVFKHKEGSVDNERSGRYVTEGIDFFTPFPWRGQPKNKKQGSDGNITMVKQLSAALLYFATTQMTKLSYKALLKLGVCAEQARFVPSHGQMTHFYRTATLEHWLRLVNQRLAADAQHEVTAIAEQVDEILFNQYPVTWAKLREESTIGDSNEKPEGGTDCQQSTRILQV